MQVSTGRWVDGANFFDRESELQILESRVSEGNHVLLTGQRRMGKTSITHELGRRLEAKGWIFLFTDVEGATCPEDVITEIAKAAHPVRPLKARLVHTLGRWFKNNVEEVNAFELGVKFRAGLNAGNWRHYGEQLIRDCAAHDKPILLVMDELPIFLKRMLGDTDGVRRVDEFLSWLRGVFQGLEGGSLALIVSGSIGLVPLVQRLDIPDRINYLYPFRLGPWRREDSVECFKRLAESHELRIDDGVANAVYEKLGIGIPHHVQFFFACLRDFAIMQHRDRVTVEDVDEVYRDQLLGTEGQNVLVHYETRLKDGLDDESHTIAMEILAEAATQDVFTSHARQTLERKYAQTHDDARDRIVEALDILVHDGYLEAGDDGYRFPSRLLKDWWAARFRDHYTPLETRLSDER